MRRSMSERENQQQAIHVFKKTETQHRDTIQISFARAILLGELGERTAMETVRHNERRKEKKYIKTTNVE